jgi:hypothetical protein
MPLGQNKGFTIMGVRQSWKINKLTSIQHLPKYLKKQLVEDIARHSKNKIRLYAWDVNEDTATLAFFSEKAALGDWLKTAGAKQYFTSKTTPEVLSVYEWEVNPSDIIRFINDHQICAVPVPPSCTKHSAVVPPNIFEDLFKP